MEKSFTQIEHEAWSERARRYDDLIAGLSTQAITPILDCLEPLASLRHVDVACGTGHLAAEASKRGAVSDGIDYAQAMVDVARSNYPGKRFHTGDATNLPYADDSIDAVTCAFGLLHMENPEKAIQEAFRVLRAGGRYAFTLWFGAEDGNEFQQIVQVALRTYAVNPLVLPEQWTQLRYANQQACERMTSAAGFGSPTFKKLDIVWRVTSGRAVVASMLEMSVRTKMVFDHQPPHELVQIYAYIESTVEARRMQGGIELAWPALLTVVQKPGQ
jgi:ubiquinone/menaquinone biosynthesis C-methylase UbiE